MGSVTPCSSLYQVWQDWDVDPKDPTRAGRLESALFEFLFDDQVWTPTSFRARVNEYRRGGLSLRDALQAMEWELDGVDS